jgi:hypothetical protein
MKTKMNIALALVALVFMCGVSAQAQVWTESFETDGLGTRYSVSNTFLNSANDFYTRTNGSNIATVTAPYNAQDGTFFWAGEDMDDITGPNLGDALTSKTITFFPIDISAVGSIQLRSLFATGFTGNGWDNTDQLYVEYNIDGAGWVKILQFATPTAANNLGLYHDTDLNGTGDGTQLNPGFQLFQANIPGAGSSLQIRIFASCNSGSEEFAFDLISVYDIAGGVAGCTDPSAANFDPLAVTDDGSCVYAGCTDALALNFDPIATIDDGSCIYTLPNIVINEVHYNPCTAQGDDNIYEFLELYNADAVAVDLTSWTLTNAVSHTFGSVSIAPGEYIVVAKLASTYSGNGYQVIQWNVGDLNNTGETISLRNNFNLLVDEVTYADLAPWPVLADGGCPSAELISTGLDNSLATNWQASYVSSGTPGLENSSAPVPTPATIVEIQTGVAPTGLYISTVGIVTCVYPAANLFTIQDGTGPNSGIWVSGSGVSVGDEVNIDAIISESFNLTLLTSPVITVISTLNALPAYEIIPTFLVSDESYEGVLVQVTGACDVDNLGFGEWSLNDLSGPAIVDDLGYAYLPTVFTTYTVRGPVYFSFSAFKITPCGAADVQKWGCTDPTAINYDSEAVIDNGTCTAAPVPGCTNPIADNFNPLATFDDGSCIISGCLDIAALNYDPIATQDDGSCYFTLPNIVINEIHFNPCLAQGDDLLYEFIELYNADAVVANLSGFTFTSGFIYTFPDGFTMNPGEYIVLAVSAASYTGNGYTVIEWTGDNLSNSGETITLEDGFGNIVDTVPFDSTAPWPNASGNCSSLELIDVTFDNALPASWQSSYTTNGTPGASNSFLLIPGCTDPVAVNYDPTANFEDGSCDYPGCTYPTASNYNPAATIDDLSCVFIDPCPADFNNDGIVGVSDLLNFIGYYGTSCE